MQSLYHSFQVKLQHQGTKLAVRNGNKQITINVVTTIIIAIGCFITNFANLRHAFAGVCATDSF